MLLRQVSQESKVFGELCSEAWASSREFDIERSLFGDAQLSSPPIHMTQQIA